MTEHRISWYESDDGKIFTDEMECYEYELNLLYKTSGVIFYIGDAKIDWIDTKDDKTYQEITDIYIDRSKTEAIKVFCNYLHDNYGWLDVEHALEGNGSHYRFSDSPFEPVIEVL